MWKIYNKLSYCGYCALEKVRLCQGELKKTAVNTKKTGTRLNKITHLKSRHYFAYFM